MTLRRKDVKPKPRQRPAASPSAPRGRRGPAQPPALGRERLVREAVALADRGGMAALSMRKLAQRLGVEAMSLYHHVGGKEEILDGMVDAVFAEVRLPAEGAGWRPAIRARMASLREALRRHPWALGLLESRTSPGGATLEHHEAVLGALRAAGFSVAAAAHAYAVLDSFVYGFVLQELNLPLREAGDAAALAESILGAFPQGSFPRLAELAAEQVTRPGYDFGNEFDFGLDLILDGLERIRG